MTSITWIRHCDFVRGRWPNGAGTSWLIAASPAGSVLPNCNWQLATALIERSAPFSVLPGIDRVITLLDGPGFRLTVAGQPDIHVDQTCVPKTFPGDRPAECHVHSGSSTVLNLLFARAELRANVEVIAETRSFSLSSDRNVTLVLALRGAVTVATATQTVDLDDGDAAVLSGIGNWEARIASDRIRTRLLTASLLRLND